MLKKIYQALPFSINFRLKVLKLRNSGGYNIGRGTYVHKLAQILGKKSFIIGDNSVLSEGSWINVNHPKQGDFAVRIGNNCFIGRRNFFSSGKQITIDDYTLTTNDCQFICSSHVVDNPLVPYIATGTTNASSIHIGVNCFIGAAAKVIGNVEIGHGSVVAASSVVLKDIPPFSMAMGFPAEVVKRYSFILKDWIKIESWTDEDEQSIISRSEYLEVLSKFKNLEMPYVAAGSDLGNLL